MPSVDIVDLNGAVVGSVELADAVFGAEVNEALMYEAVRHHTAARRSGSAATKTRHEVVRFRQEIVEAEGHGPRAHGLHSIAAVAPWRNGAWTATAQLRL